MQRHFNKRVMSFIVVGVVLAGALAAYLRQGHSAHPLVHVDTDRFAVMGTFARIHLRCIDEQTGRSAIEQAMLALDRVDRLMSTYRQDSELSEVNRNAGYKPVGVSAETYNLLAKAQHYAKMTSGAFDITVTPLLRTWQLATKNNHLPTAEELDRTRVKIGYDKLVLSEPAERRVTFMTPDMEVNVDALAKGYAVDRALATLRRKGVSAALVEIGGEVACFGQDRPGQNWLVGIQDPFADDNDNPLSERARWVMALHDASVATSGNYRRLVMVAGQPISHIIDPRTGSPAAALPSVTIIAPRAVDADAIATAVSVMGPEEGIKLVESLPEMEAFLIAGTKQQPVIYRSSGFSRFEVPTKQNKNLVTSHLD